MRIPRPTAFRLGQPPRDDGGQRWVAVRIEILALTLTIEEHSHPMFTGSITRVRIQDIPDGWMVYGSGETRLETRSTSGGLRPTPVGLQTLSRYHGMGIVYSRLTHTAYVLCTKRAPRIYVMANPGRMN